MKVSKRKRKMTVDATIQRQAIRDNLIFDREIQVQVKACYVSKITLEGRVRQLFPLSTLQQMQMQWKTNNE